MFFIFIVTVVGVLSAKASKSLNVINGGNQGVWGAPQYCANNTYAVGYDMKIEGQQGLFGDDTALNGIRLICRSPSEASYTDNHATSTVGPWGSWVGETRCDNNSFLMSFSLQVEPKLTAGDDTSANYVKFKCCELEGYQPPYEMFKSPGFGKWGSYRSWSPECPKGKAICGLKTRVQAPRGAFADDTALNDVVFYCC